MARTILTVNDRGTVTLPSSYRKKVKTRHFTYGVVDNKLILEPLQSREEFMAELDAAEKNWGKHGGLTLEQFERKYGLRSPRKRLLRSHSKQSV